MILIRAAILCLLFSAAQDPTAQEPVTQLVLMTKDGQRVVGTPSTATLKIENSLGTIDLSYSSLSKIKFDGDTVTGFSRDGTTLKGKPQAKDFKLSTVLGDLEIKLGDLKEAVVQAAPPATGARPENVSEVFLLRTKDGNELVGPTTLLKFPFESTLGKFEVDVKHLHALTRAEENHVIHLRDGSEMRGTAGLSSGVKIQSAMGEFTVKPEDIAVLQYRGNRAEAPRPPRGEGPKPAPAPPALQPAAQRKVAAVLGKIRMTREGKHLYAMNVSDGKLCRWKLPGLEEDGMVPLPGGEKAVSLDSTGSFVFAAGGSSISVFSTEPFKLLKTFAVDVQVEDIYALDKDTLLSASTRTFAIISIPKTAVVEKIRGGATNIELSPKDERIYAGDSILQISREAGGSAQVTPLIAATGGSSLSISPDGRFGCTIPDARVLRLGRCWAAARVHMGQLDAGSASAFSRDSSRLYLINASGFLKVFGTEDLTIAGSHFLGIRGVDAIVEPQGNFMIISGVALGEEAGRASPHRQSRREAAIDLYRFEIPK